jgi:hypothetical protein
MKPARRRGTLCGAVPDLLSQKRHQDARCAGRRLASDDTSCDPAISAYAIQSCALYHRVRRCASTARTARREASPFAECDHANARGAPMAHELQHDRVSERKGMLSMTRSKRQYGSGCLLTRGRGWAIRWRVTEITRQEVQAYVAHLVNNGYAPRTTDHIHDVLSAVLRTAVKWGHLQENPARAVDLGALINVRPKWALTIAACNRTTSS